MEKKKKERGENERLSGVERRPRSGGSMAEVPLKRPIFIRLWVEGKNYWSSARRNVILETMNRGNHLDRIFFFFLSSPPFLGGKPTRLRFCARDKKKEKRKIICESDVEKGGEYLPSSLRGNG